MKERFFTPAEGDLAATVLLIVAAVTLYGIYISVITSDYDLVRIGMFLSITALTLIAIRGFLIVSPGQSIILVFGGRYIGTIIDNGWWWHNPLYARKKVSVLRQEHHTALVDATDMLGDPIEVSACIEWSVHLPAVVTMTLADPAVTVANKARAVLQRVIRQYPFSNEDLEMISLKFDLDKINKEFQRALTHELAPVGIEVIGTHIGQLNYTREYNAAMVATKFLKQIAGQIGANSRLHGS